MNWERIKLAWRVLIGRDELASKILIDEVATLMARNADLRLVVQHRDHEISRYQGIVWAAAWSIPDHTLRIPQTALMVMNGASELQARTDYNRNEMVIVAKLGN